MQDLPPIFWTPVNDTPPQLSQIDQTRACMHRALHRINRQPAGVKNHGSRRACTLALQADHQVSAYKANGMVNKPSTVEMVTSAVISSGLVL